jgi:signal transduction histidine kinase
VHLAFIITISTILFFLGFSAFATNYKRESNVLFFFVSILLVAWVVSNYISNTTTSYLVSLWTNRFIFTSTSLLTWFLFVFSLYFPSKPEKSQRRVVLLSLLGIIPVSILSLTTAIVSDITLKEGYSEITFGWAITLYILHFAIFLCLFLINLFIKMRKSRGVDSLKIQYLLLGLSLSTAGALVTNFVFPFFFETFSLSNLGPTFLVFFIFSTFYTIVRHRFLGIRVVLGQFIHLLLLSLFVLIGTIFIQYLMRQIAEKDTPLEWLAITVIVILMFTWMLLQLSKRIEAFIRQRFIYITFDPEAAIGSFTKKTSITLDLEAIESELLAIIGKSYDTVSVGLIFFNPSTQETITKKIEGFEEDYLLSIKTLFPEHRLLTQYEIVTKDELEQGGRNNPLLRNVYPVMDKLGIQVISILGEKMPNKGFLTIGHKGNYTPYTSEDLQFILRLSDIAEVAIERAQLHGEVQNFNVTLQQKVASATKELKDRNKELEDLYQNLEEIYRKEKDLMDIAGHEFRTPASILKNNLYLLKRRLAELQKDKPDEKIQRYLDRLVEGTDRQIKLVDTFLESARIDNQRFEIQVEKTDLTQLFSAAVSDAKPFAEQKNLSIIYSPPQKPIMAEVDKVRIREVVDNLLNNAVKYTKKGHIAPRLAETERSVIFSVKDTGIGIKPEDQPLLFKKFSRVDNYIGGEEGSIVRPGGTGLGLFVAKTIIDSHGGQINVESTPGVGSTFTIEIPKVQPSYIKRARDLKGIAFSAGDQQHTSQRLVPQNGSVQSFAVPFSQHTAMPEGIPQNAGAETSDQPNSDKEMLITTRGQEEHHAKNEDLKAKDASNLQQSPVVDNQRDVVENSKQ